LTRTFSPAAKPYQPLPNEFKTAITAASTSALLQDLKTVLRDINVEPRERNENTFWNRDDQHETCFVDLCPAVHSWSRQARRKTIKGISRNSSAQEDSKPLFEARLQVSLNRTPDHEHHTREASPSKLARDHSEKSYTVHLLWLRGQDRAIINTFWAYLSRKMIERTLATVD
jgi:hypothetical protein